MSLLDASQQLWLPSFRSQRKPAVHGLRAWISDGTFRIEQPPTKKNTTLVVDASSEVAHALSSDIVRYSSAAIESVYKLEGIAANPKATGWILIRIYYAAYFAANTIMRFFGHFCVNLDQSHVAAIHELASLYEVSIPASPKTKLSAGTFAGRYSPSNGGAVVIQSLHTIGGGAHKQFWFAFRDFLDSLSVDVKGCALSSGQRDTVKYTLRSLRERLCQANNPNGGWLSEVRNAVNYRLEYGAWYPYEASQVDVNDFLALIDSGISANPAFRVADPSLPDLYRCADTCTFLMSWMLASIAKLSDQARGGSKHFLSGVPVSLLE